MDKQVIFKSAINGFEKASVLKYIDELNVQLAQKDEALAKQTEDFRKQKENLTEKISTLEIYAKDIQKKMDEELGKEIENESCVAELKAELNKIQLAAEEKDHEIAKQKEENAQIKSKLEEIEAKSKKYDEAAASIGNVILEARQEATRIKDDAEEKAQKYLEEAKEKADAVIAEAIAKAKEIKEDSDKECQFIQEKLSELKGQFAYVHKQINAAMSVLDERFGEAEDNIRKKEEAFAEKYCKVSESEKTDEENGEKQGHSLKTILEQAAASAQKSQIGERAKEFGNKVKDSINKIEKM